MSNQRNTRFVEMGKNKWYYAVESINPYHNSVNWLEDAIVAGPFNSMDEADAVLLREHGNTGGGLVEYQKFMTAGEKAKWAVVFKNAQVPEDKSYTFKPRYF